MKIEAFIEVEPSFGGFGGSTRELLSVLPKEVYCIEYVAGKLRFFFKNMPERIPGFLKEMYPHCSFNKGFYGER